MNGTPIARWRALLASDRWLVVAVAVISLACFVLSERVKVGDGFGWDGILYGNWARDFYREVFVTKVNTYYIQRVLPSAVVHYSLRFLHIPRSDAAILTAFGIQACVLLTFMAECWRRIARELGIGTAGKWLGFSALFLNYIALKYVYYCPVSTDIWAYALGMVMLLFYLRGQTVWLVEVTAIGAFCWPLCVPVGAIMLVFPRTLRPHAVPSSTPRFLQFAAAAALTGGAAAVFLIALRRPPTIDLVNVQPEFVTPFYPLLYLSIAVSVAYVFFGSVSLFGSGCLPSPRELFSARRMLVGLLVVIGAFSLKFTQSLMARHEPTHELTALLYQTAFTSVTRPGIFLVTHVAFYGPFLILAAFFWRTTCKEMQCGGPALPLCVLMALILSLNSQSRFFLNVYPILVPFAVVAIEKRGFGRVQLGCIAIISLLTSKIWLTINTGPFHGRLHEFPDQGLFLNHGPWISPEMYGLQGIAYAFLGLILYRVWFRVRKATTQLAQTSESVPVRGAA